LHIEKREDFGDLSEQTAPLHRKDRGTVQNPHTLPTDCPHASPPSPAPPTSPLARERRQVGGERYAPGDLAPGAPPSPSRPGPPPPGVSRLVPLGGLGEIGMNCLALEQEEGIVVVDCGVTFPSSDLGIDVYHPRFDYLVARADR